MNTHDPVYAAELAGMVQFAQRHKLSKREALVVAAVFSTAADKVGMLRSSLIARCTVDKAVDLEMLATVRRAAAAAKNELDEIERIREAGNRRES